MSTAQQTMATQRARSYSTLPGSHLPLGATVDEHGVNFALFTRTAAAVELRLYADADSEEPLQVVALDPETNRTLFCWHVYVEALEPGVYYTWRAADSAQALVRAPELFDPWARAASDAGWDRQAAMARLANSKGLRAIVVAPIGESIDALPIMHTVSDAVIYEMHVGGFTRHASSGVRHPGTFSGLIEKIPYLKALGVTHVELLPVMAFDEQDVPLGATARGLKNYWGYSTYGFYAPHPRYCVDAACAPQEFRDCVHALHEAGIRVLLDVVFNHTAEGGATGPTINFKALANDIFYHHDPHDPNSYRDFTGCGNTVNCNHPLVTNFILRCLEYWTNELGVDGFRFDLASVFARGEDGAPLADPPLTWGIELSHPLARRPIIAEAWDAAGLYQVGSFPGLRWAEWNGRYRDVVRRFVRSEPGLVGQIAARLAGSQDMYGRRTPLHSINFVTCHDGFTLHDLVSYDGKHNEANGENNRDGNNDNLSWNCGVEGATADASVLELRRRQAKNFMAILMLSQGVPMILAGDEVLRTQAGNNNAYSQDNELSWFDWRLIDTQREMLRFTRELIALRKRHPTLRRQRFLTGRAQRNGPLPDVTWHGERLHEPSWQDPEARLLAFTLAGTAPDEKPLHIIFNMWWESRTVDVPSLPGCTWRLAVDTALAAPDDVRPSDEQAVNVHQGYVAQPRSVVVLEAH